MTMVIREARAEELDETARILVAAFEEHRPPADSAVTPQQRVAFERYLEDIANVRSRRGAADLFVAVDADRLVGTGTLYPPRLAPTYPGPHAPPPWPSEWATLRLLGVPPAHRGRGIGRMLVEARIERARALGAPVVALHTSFEVSRSMYQRLGWQRASEYDYFPAAEILAEAYILALR
jgi:GNAT superfamily N-acetyltransferase